MHGARAGRPPQTGFYSHVLHDDERADYERGLDRDAQGELRHEIAFARAKLASLERRAVDATDESVPWDHGRREWLRTIERLELAQRQLAGSNDDETRQAVLELVDKIRRRRG